jgi:hypothetical protein
VYFSVGGGLMLAVIFWAALPLLRHSIANMARMDYSSLAIFWDSLIAYLTWDMVSRYTRTEIFGSFMT